MMAALLLSGCLSYSESILGISPITLRAWFSGDHLCASDDVTILTLL